VRDLDEIECFVKAVELKSLTAAAKALSRNPIPIFEDGAA
jgi:DNA-binding transcriptional LysR family regulator